MRYRHPVCMKTRESVREMTHYPPHRALRLLRADISEHMVNEYIWNIVCMKGQA